MRATTRNIRKKLGRSLTFIEVFLVIAICMVPIILIIINSLRTNTEVAKALFGLPRQLHFENYTHVFQTGNYWMSYLLNVWLGFGSVMLSNILIIAAAYGIICMNAKGAKFLTGYFLLSMSLPTFGILIPLYFIYIRLGLNDTILGLIFIFVAMNIPFAFLLVRSYFIGLQRELLEAAKIDGAGNARILIRIILPITMPIVSTIALVVFASTWNNFQIPNIFYSSAEHKVVSMNFYLFMGKVSTDMAYLFTAAVLAMMPVFILYFFLQKNFIEGMTSGSVKG